MEPEQRLIERARTEESAFLELYTRYYPKLFGYLLVQGRDKELAEDITQETFLKAIEGLEDATGGGHEVATGARVLIEDLPKFMKKLER